MTQSFGNDEQYTLVLFKFTKSAQVANVGSLSVYTTAQYEAVKAQGGPVPTLVFSQNGIVLAFTGLQDMPFDLGTEAADLVANYHMDVATILKTIALTDISQ